jgi:hypothetical protein
MVKIVTHGPYRIRQTSGAAEKALAGTQAPTISQSIPCPPEKKSAQTAPARKKPAQTAPARTTKATNQ